MMPEPAGFEHEISGLRLRHAYRTLNQRRKEERQAFSDNPN